jgi:cystathionine beta-lyase family protein involved in aluminum resistance
MAPKVVNAALKGAVLCGSIYSKLGFDVMPMPGTHRNDIIQAIKFRDPEKTILFCQSIQSSSPIDSYVTPVPWDMPGYSDQVIMAAGAFVQGSSIELSADAPLREPYIAYFQGGLTYEHARYGIIKSVDTLYKKGMIGIG